MYPCSLVLKLMSCSPPLSQSKIVFYHSADEYWQNHPELHDIPIYYASSLAKKCMAVYQTYVNAMNDKIRKAININNPFVFKHISNLKVCTAGAHTRVTQLGAPGHLS